MITKYRTDGWRKLIDIVEVERETGSSVWINGRRNAKTTDYHCYFDSFEDAKSYLLKSIQMDINIATARLSTACAKKQDLLSMNECDVR